MANTFRPATSGAGQEIVARLDALLSIVSTGTATTVNSSDYTSKDWLTETDGRNIATKLASLMTAFKTYVAPSAKKVQAALKIGSKTYDGSAAVTISEATTSAAGLLSASDKTKLNGIESGAQKNTVTGVKGSSETSYRTGNINLTKANIGLSNVDNTSDAAKPVSTAQQDALDKKEDIANLKALAYKDSLSKSDVGLGNVDNVKQYSASNPPPYPVTKVNGKTGTVSLTISDVMGSTAIGDDFNAIYWDGTKFAVQEPSLEKASWATINSLVQSGKAASLFKVGDEKTITLTTGEEVTLVILGFDHDDKADGSGKAGITFGMKNLLATKYPMNSSNTNVGGWDSSAMRTETMATLLSLLPADLRAVIKPVSKKATSGNKSTAITTSTDSLFLFSDVELDGTTTAGYADEGEQYEYWKTRNTANDRIKKLSNGSGSADNWWLRSPYTSGATGFRCVNYDGYVTSYRANYSCGVCFGFCI